MSTALTATGYITAMSAAIAVSGGFLSITVNRYLHWTIPSGILTLVQAGLAVFLMIWGIAVFAKLAGLFLGVGILVLAVISVVVFIKNGGHLSLAPLEPTHITSGFSGLAAGSQVAVYPFTDGGRQERQAGRAMTWRHHGGVSDPSKTSDTRMVRQ